MVDLMETAREDVVTSRVKWLVYFLFLFCLLLYGGSTRPLTMDNSE